MTHICLPMLSYHSKWCNFRVFLTTYVKVYIPRPVQASFSTWPKITRWLELELLEPPLLKLRQCSNVVAVLPKNACKLLEFTTHPKNVENWYRYITSHYPLETVGVVDKTIENSTLVGCVWLGPCFVGQLGSGVWVSASFQWCTTCRIYIASICTPFTAILPVVWMGQW